MLLIQRKPPEPGVPATDNERNSCEVCLFPIESRFCVKPPVEPARAGCGISGHSNPLSGRPLHLCHRLPPFIRLQLVPVGERYPDAVVMARLDRCDERFAGRTGHGHRSPIRLVSGQDLRDPAINTPEGLGFRCVAHHADNVIAATFERTTGTGVPSTSACLQTVPASTKIRCWETLRLTALGSGRTLGDATEEGERAL
jgi:hypothetical protein